MIRGYRSPVEERERVGAVEIDVNRLWYSSCRFFQKPGFLPALLYNQWLTIFTMFPRR
jgi:hypothetical protein